MLICKDRSHYRSRPDVIAEILSSCEKPLGKTRVMYMAFLSNAQTREYLTELYIKQFLVYDGVSRTYQTTEQGLEYLRLYEVMKDL